MTRAGAKAYKDNGSVIISRKLQLIFILAIFGSWLFGQLSLVVNVLVSGAHLSLNGWWFNIAEAAFSILLLGIGYWFADRVSGVRRLFDASLRALIGVSVLGMLTMVANHFAMSFALSSGSTPPGWLVGVHTQMTLMGVTLVGYILGQYWWANWAKRR